MSSNCIIQNCSQNCCNIDGFCPTSFGTSNQMSCYYYYSWYIWSFWWIYFVIVVGSLLCLAMIIACCVACCRRRRMRYQDTIIITQQTQPSYQQPYNQYGIKCIIIRCNLRNEYGCDGNGKSGKRGQCDDGIACLFGWAEYSITVPAR